MHVKFFGHSTFLLEIAGSKVLLDPFITDNPSTNVDPMTIECDYMLLSHGHGDHVGDAVGIAKNTGCTVLANYEVAQWIKGKGIEKVMELNHGGSHRLDFGSVKYVNAIHSSVLPDGTYGGNPGGFVIDDGSREYYYAGDTALTLDMELLGRFHDIALSFLPMGDVYTMGVEDASRAAEMVQCKRVIGMHFDTFPPLSIDHEAAKKTFADKGIELTLMSPGEDLDF